MSTPFSQQQIKQRTALLMFIKGSAAPLVLYFEKPQEVYKELQSIIKVGSNIAIEKETIGPIKKFTVMSGQISAIALQEEQFI